MSRHLALDPREPPVQVTMPRQGQSPDGGSSETVVPQGFEPADAGPPPVAATDPPVSRRASRSQAGPPVAEPPLSGQPLPRVRPAARHHSGSEYGSLRRPPRSPGSPKATAPRGMRLSKALLALLGSALVAALAGAWAYHSWSDNRALARGGSGAAKAQVVILDGVADTGTVRFLAGSSVVVPVNVDNPGQKLVAVQGIEPGKVVMAQDVPGCEASLVKAVGEHSDLTIPPGGGVFDATIAMSKDAPPLCQGIPFSVTFVVTGSVAAA